MSKIWSYICVALLLLLLRCCRLAGAEVFAKQLTIFVDAGRMECFNQPVSASELIQIEYQVIHGGHGEPHINFMLMDPKRQVLAAEKKLSHGHHNLTAEETGSFALCFDNTISLMNRKIVSFNLQVIAADYERQQRDQLRKEMQSEYHYDRAFTDMYGCLRTISVNLMRARQLQDLIRAHEARDRHLAEVNFTMVNNWSCVQFVCMIVVGLVQVFMLRSIFHTDGRLYRFWKRF